MANWFKVYETDLDDTNLQYAMDHNPHVAMVYLGLLAECCKLRAPTIRWTLSLELPALAKKVHLSVGVINDSVGWLKLIGWVKSGDGTLTVTGWSSRQSDYMNRKVNHQSVHSHPRGEKIRGRALPSGRPSEGEQAMADAKEEPGSAFRKQHPLPGELLFVRTGVEPHDLP